MNQPKEAAVSTRDLAESTQDQHKSTPGLVIQFGSGHPGEENSAGFEASLFEEHRLGEGNIVFFPFHNMPPHSGDLALFERLHAQQTRGWIYGIQLRPPRRPPNLEEIKTRVEDASLIVLGSGFPEPYIHLLRRLGFAEIFRTLHQRGAHFMGYSAGTVALSEGYFRPFNGRDLLLQLDLLDHISLSDEQRDELEGTLKRNLKREDAEEYIDAVRARVEADEALTDEDEDFLEQSLWMEQAAGFRLAPGLTANPHYGSRLHYVESHLRMLGQMFPDWLHVGIPNGCALVTRHGTDGSGRQTLFRGRNARFEGGCVSGRRALLTLENGSPLPL